MISQRITWRALFLMWFRWFGVILGYLGIIHELFKSLFYKLCKLQKCQDFIKNHDSKTTKEFMSCVMRGTNTEINVRF